MPSGASVAVECLVRLGSMTDDAEALEMVSSYLAGRLAQAGEQPYGSARLFAGADLLLHGVELVISEGDGRETLLAAARAAYAPTMMLAGPWAAPAILDGKSSVDGKAAAYVCRQRTCAAPVHSADALVALLTEGPGRGAAQATD